MVTHKAYKKLGGRGSLGLGEVGTVLDVDEDMQAGGRVKVQGKKSTYWYDMEELGGACGEQVITVFCTSYFVYCISSQQAKLALCRILKSSTEAHKTPRLMLMGTERRMMLLPQMAPHFTVNKWDSSNRQLLE